MRWMTRPAISAGSCLATLIELRCLRLRPRRLRYRLRRRLRRLRLITRQLQPSVLLLQMMQVRVFLLEPQSHLLPELLVLLLHHLETEPDIGFINRKYVSVASLTFVAAKAHRFNYSVSVHTRRILITGRTWARRPDCLLIEYPHIRIEQSGGGHVRPRHPDCLLIVYPHIRMKQSIGGGRVRPCFEAGVGVIRRLSGRPVGSRGGLPGSRGLHSFTSQLNLSALYGIGGVRKGLCSPC